MTSETVRIAKATETLDGGRVNGAILASHLQWISTNQPGAMTLVGARLSAEAADLLGKTLSATDWIPFRTLVEIDRAIAAATGAEERVVAVELGRHSARVNIPRPSLAPSRDRPHDFFQKIASVHYRFQDFGRASYERTGASSCRITMSELTCFSKIYCWTAVGYFEAAAGVCGGGAAQATEAACTCEGGAACVFDVGWI